MPSHLPTANDFSPLTVVITPQTASQRTPTNVVLFLHGVGDTATSFSAFSRGINLPESLCLTIQAPTPLPFDLGGFHWGDDILFDQGSGGMEFDAGFNKVTKILTEVVKDVLIQQCGYRPREILMFGFGQGGMAALAATAALDMELGGAISIGGPLPASVTPPSGNAKKKTPVLILGGSSGSLVGRPAVMEKFKDAFENVQYHKWKKSGDAMPQNREEMLPIMQFFSRRLRSRQGVPEGSVEIA